MKIGIIETGLPPHQIGGAELQAWELARRLTKKKHELFLFTRQQEETEKYQEKEGIKIFRTLPFRRPFGIVSYILGLFLLVFRQRKKLDILLCFRAWPNGIIGLMAHKFLGLPVCVTIRGGDWYFVEPYWWGKIVYKLLCNNRIPIAVQTKKIRDEITSAYPDISPIIVPNGVEIKRDEVPHGESVLFVGNLIPRKGVHVLLEVIRQLKDYPCVIVGDGPERDSLERRAGGLNVRFLGSAAPEEVKKLMIKHGKVFVLPAVAGEGLPNVLLEAMSIGLPVIASDVAGIRDLLENGKAGRIVPPDDSVALAEAIREIWEGDELRTTLAQSGRKTAELYSWDNITVKWEQIFAEMINGSKLEKTR